MRNTDPNNWFTNREPTAADREAVNHEIRTAFILGIVGACFAPLGWFAIYKGVQAINRSKDAGLGTPVLSVIGIVIASWSTLSLLALPVILTFAEDAKHDRQPPVISEPAPEPPPAEDAPSAKQPVAVQPGSSRDQPRLSLKVTKVYEKQKPSAKAPFHEKGGDWTFFDLEGDGGVALTAGFRIKPTKDVFSFGEAQLSVPSAEAGAKFLSAFDEQFGGDAGDGAVGKLRALKMGAAILGEKLIRERHGGFHTGLLGAWTATKLFPEAGGKQGEVFFNFSLDDGVAEFTEKDAEYKDDLAFVFASAFTGK